MREKVRAFVEHPYWRLAYEIWMCVVGLAIVLFGIRHWPII